MMTKFELQKILAQHKEWVESRGKEGKEADLSFVNLSGADSIGVDLTEANLRGADLTEAKGWEKLND
ncbi:MAG TPA: pentapeptide repeat-containing protein [Vampirovibrionales bacterium]